MNASAMIDHRAWPHLARARVIARKCSHGGVIKSRFCASEKNANTLSRGCDSQRCDSKFRTRIKSGLFPMNLFLFQPGAEAMIAISNPLKPWTLRHLIRRIHLIRHFHHIRPWSFAVATAQQLTRLSLAQPRRWLAALQALPRTRPAL